MEELLIKDQIAVESHSRTIFEGVSICDKCNRVIPSKIIYKQGFNYLVKKCPFDGYQNESLITKGNFFPSRRELPSSWPRWKLEVGQKNISDKNLINITNTPVLTLHLTSRCNSSCKICLVKYLQSQNQIKDKDVDIRYIESKLFHFKNKEVVLCGGEPTVREDLVAIIRMVKRTKNIPALQTNGLKLADITYLKKLKTAGLKHVYLSFEGFDRKTHELIRRKGDYELKLMALKNLKKEKIRTTLQTIIIKGLNEDQVKQLISYAKENNFISEIRFKPLYLMGKEEFAGFSKEHLISKRELEQLITNALGITSEYFSLWDELKYRLAFRIQGLFPWVNLPVFEDGKLYFVRKDGEFRPLLYKKELINIIEKLEKRAIDYSLISKSLKWVPYVIRQGLSVAKLENGLFRNGNLFRISIVTTSLGKDLIFSDKMPVTNLNYTLPDLWAALY